MATERASSFLPIYIQAFVVMFSALGCKAAHKRTDSDVMAVEIRDDQNNKIGKFSLSGDKIVLSVCKRVPSSSPCRELKRKNFKEYLTSFARIAGHYDYYAPYDISQETADFFKGKWNEYARQYQFDQEDATRNKELEWRTKFYAILDMMKVKEEFESNDTFFVDADRADLKSYLQPMGLNELPAFGASETDETSTGDGGVPVAGRAGYFLYRKATLTHIATLSANGARPMTLKVGNGPDVHFNSCSGAFGQIVTQDNITGGARVNKKYNITIFRGDQYDCASSIDPAQ